MEHIKRIAAAVLAAVLVIAAVPSAFALEPGTVYYVDSAGGNDANSGTSQSSAWRTVEKASSLTYLPGDKILFKAGGYFEGAFTARGSGTAQYPVVLGAYGDTASAGKPMLTVKDERTLITLNNVSGWTVENLDLSAPESRAITLTAQGCVVTDLTVKNCDIHDVWYYQTPTARGYNSAVYIAANGLDTRIERLQLVDIDIRDCAYGIHMGGNTIEFSPELYVSPEQSYSRFLLFENVDMYNILYDAMAICSVDDLRIRNCALINTSLYTDYYTAPLWMHHANNVVVEYCEVAGSTNYKDGMTVDFDGWTTNSTYQYIYSHDNVRFMQNCVYDDTTRNRNCTVRYCLSVNDNDEPNNVALCNSPAYTDADNPKYMEGFKFYNNTIVNGSAFKLYSLHDSVIANNIFYGDLSQYFATSLKTGDMGIISYDGVFSNNCFYGCTPPFEGTQNQFDVNPAFTGSNLNDIESFRLSSSSPLLGEGIAADTDMGAHDFYGNPLTDTHNIGCYDGEGIDTAAVGDFSSYDYNVYSAILKLLAKFYALYISISYLW